MTMFNHLSKRWVAYSVAFVAVFCQPILGQVKDIKKILLEKQQVKTQAPESSDDAKNRLTQWQKDARQTLTKLEDSATVLPKDVTIGDVEDYRRDAEQVVLTISRYLKSLENEVAASQSIEAAREKGAAWTGFKEPPPYSLLMVDELRNEQDTVHKSLTSYESSLEVLQRTLAQVIKETKAIEEKAKQVSTDSDDGEAWRQEAARVKSRALAVRAGLLQSNCEILKSKIAAANLDAALLSRQIKIAMAQSRFNKDDLAKVQSLVTERQAAIQQELEKISSRLKAAASTNNQAQAALAGMNAAASEGTPPAGIDLAKIKVEVAENRLDILQSIAEVYENLKQLENLSLNAYHDRQVLLNAATANEREKPLASLEALRDRFHAWKDFSTSEIAASLADLGRIEAKSAPLGSDDPRASLFAEQRALQTEKTAILRRVSHAVETQLEILDRWITDYAPHQDNHIVYQTILSVADKAWGRLQSIWSFEVMKGEVSLEVEGQKTTIFTPVTLGILLRALFFFVIAYQIASFIAKRVQKSIISRGHIAEAQARTLKNWAMVVVSIFLAIGTLSLLNIPLTIFAFLGGALAIGLGFGMQTLIKNFISGIIVLFERKIRVGDIVDIGGIVGNITEINTRSSVLRGADGKESLVPNSLFLENRVTNLTLTNRVVRNILTVRVAIGSPTQKVSTILKETAERHGLILEEPSPIVTFEDFADGAHVFAVYYWTEFNSKTNTDVVASDLRFMIEKQFVEAEIEFAATRQMQPNFRDSVQ